MRLAGRIEGCKESLVWLFQHICLPDEEDSLISKNRYSCNATIFKKLWVVKGYFQEGGVTGTYLRKYFFEKFDSC